MLFQFSIFLIIFLLIMFFLGYFSQKYLDFVYFDKRCNYFKAIEKIICNISSTHNLEKGNWKVYVLNIIKLSFVSGLFTFCIFIFQGSLPLNPNNCKDLDPWLALNITLSFLTQTDWQSYQGENQLSYLSQSVGLGLHLFFAPAVALSVAIAVIRGITTDISEYFGNFWQDFTKSILYILMPLSFLLSIILLSFGSIQNYLPNAVTDTLEGFIQALPMGPVASNGAIKIVGGNGGGFFNANGAHPFETPSELVLILQSIFLFLIPSSLILLLGKKANLFKHGVSVWLALALLLFVFLSMAFVFENNTFGILSHLGQLEHTNIEGKEMRLGVGLTAFFNGLNTATSTGVTAGAFDSFSPLAGGVSLFMVMLGSFLFGGTGAGLYSVFIYVVLTVFICGLMVGRTPEYLGKRIEDYEIKWAILSLLFVGFSTLVGPAVALNTKWGIDAVSAKGPHGLTQILYAFGSTTSNNGSSFAGLNTTHPAWHIATGVAMVIGRFGCIVPALAIASSLGLKKRYAINEMSFPVYGYIFLTLLAFVIVIIGGLTYLPAVVLGPITDFAQLMTGKLY